MKVLPKDCPYCEQVDAMYQMAYLAFELPESKVYVFRNQTLLGRVIVASKYHVSEMVDLTDEQRDGFFKDVNTVAKAIHKAYTPDKVQYASYADTMCHFHFHLVPKYIDGYNWGKPFSTPGDDKVFFNDEQCKEVAEKIKSCLE